MWPRTCLRVQPPGRYGVLAEAVGNASRAARISAQALEKESEVLLMMKSLLGGQHPQNAASFPFDLLRVRTGASTRARALAHDDTLLDDSRAWLSARRGF